MEAEVGMEAASVEFPEPEPAEEPEVPEPPPKRIRKSQAKSPLPTDYQSVTARFDSLKDLKDLEQLQTHNRGAKPVDGNLYVKDREPVVYIEQHGMFYTRRDVVERQVLRYQGTILPRQVGRTRKSKSNLLILQDEKGKDTLLSDGITSYHPKHVVRVPGRRGPNEFCFESGDGERIRMTDLFAEHAVAQKQANDNTREMKCYLHPDAVFTFRYDPKTDKYYNHSECPDCMKQRVSDSRLAAIQTVEGKARSLATDSVRNQNGRNGIPKLTYDLHTDPLAAVFRELLARVMELPLVKEMDLKVYHFSNDKLCDEAGRNYYIGNTDGRIDFTNLSVTPSINNPPISAYLSDAVRSEAIQLGELPPPALSRTEDVLEAINGNHLQKIVSAAKADQKSRNKGKGNKGKFKELTEADFGELKKRVLKLFVATGGKCHVSGVRISFTEPDRLFSIDRLNNEVGYEVESNLSLVLRYFNTELRQSQRLEPLKWTPDLFRLYGARILRGEATVKYVDLPVEMRERIETEWAGRVPVAVDTKL
eukprot:Hpha_TRINITY_DN16131_c4_g4::TRINITY_DN16131_c4_g4_i1::g.4567::m.4567